jgi:hypothetical protein
VFENVFKKYICQELKAFPVYTSFPSTRFYPLCFYDIYGPAGESGTRTKGKGSVV